MPGQSILDPNEIQGIQEANPEGIGDPAAPPDHDDYLRESPGIVGKLVGRLFGTDVDDPLPWTRMGTTLAGGIGGGMYGSQIPGPPVVKAAGAVLGGLAGTVSGAVAPETTLEALEMTGILEPGERERIGLSNSQLMTVLEGEALLDLATFGGVSAIRGASRGLSSIMTGANVGTRRMAEEATREGIALLPVQVGEGTFARGFVSVMGRFPWVASGLKKRSQTAIDQISRAFDGIPERLGPTSTFDEVSGRILREATATAETVSGDFQRQFSTLLARADMNGIQVGPVATRSVTTAVEKELNRSVPRGFDTHGNRNSPLDVPPMQKDLTRFIRGTVSKLYMGNQLAYQSLRQMDNLLQTIDVKMTKYAESGDTVTMGRLERIRQAVATDMVARQVSANGGPLSPAQQEIGREFSRLDQELTETMNFLFNSTTAQRMGAKVSPANRSAMLTDTGMRGPDSMAKVLLRGENPSAIREIERLVSPETMQRLGNAYFAEAMNKSMVTVGDDVRRFDVDSFEKAIGLNAPNSAKYAQTRELLRSAGGMTMDQVQSLADIARRASEAEIPDVSTFIARQATFSGIRGAVRAAIPFATVAGAGAVGGGAGGGLVAGMVAILGAKGMGAMISNPVSARALSRVMDVEARDSVRKAAWLRAGGAAVGQMLQIGEIDTQQAQQLEQTLRVFAVEFDKATRNNDNP